MIRQVPGTGESLELSAVRDSQVEVPRWPAWSGEAWCAFQPYRAAIRSRVLQRTVQTATASKIAHFWNPHGSGVTLTGQSGMSCSTRRGAVVSIIIVESNWTRVQDQHGLSWHCMALHLALALPNSSLLVRDRRWPLAKPHRSAWVDALSQSASCARWHGLRYCDSLHLRAGSWSLGEP